MVPLLLFPGAAPEHYQLPLIQNEHKKNQPTHCGSLAAKIG